MIANGIRAWVPGGVVVLLAASVVGGWIAWRSADTADISLSHPPLHAQRADLSREITPKQGGGIQLPREDPLVPDAEMDAWLKRASANPPAVMEEVLKLQDEEKRYEIADWVLDAWLTDGPQPVLEWAAGYFNHSPVSGGEDLLELLTGSRIHEAESHLNWIRDHLPPPWLELGERMTAAAWAETDPDALQDWLEKPEQKTVQDFWKEELVLGLISEDPAQAMTVADRYFSQEEAWALQEGVLQSWLLQNPAEADAWAVRDGRFVNQLQALRQSMDMPLARPGEPVTPGTGVSPLSPRLLPSPAR